MTYFRVATGYQSGGFNGRGTTLAGVTTPFNEQTSLNYEIGSKSTLWQQRMTLNTSIFYTENDDILSGVVSVSYSWTWGGKNVTGLLEYYRNGFGQSGGRYGPEDLLQNPDLLRRIERGELFTLGRNYLAASATIELNPRFMLIPNAFINLDDPSALAQFVGQFDWKQNLQLLMALNLPVGSSGTEYGGIETGIEGKYFSSGPGAFVQLAWYF